MNMYAIDLPTAVGHKKVGVGTLAIRSSNLRLSTPYFQKETSEGSAFLSAGRKTRLNACKHGFCAGVLLHGGASRSPREPTKVAFNSLHFTHIA